MEIMNSWTSCPMSWPQRWIMQSFVLATPSLLLSWGYTRDEKWPWGGLSNGLEHTYTHSLAQACNVCAYSHISHVHMTHAYINTCREYLCWWQWGVIGVGGSSFWQEARQKWLPWGQSQCTFMLLQINLFSIIWLSQTHLCAVGMVDRQAVKAFALTIKPPKAGLRLAPTHLPL